MTGPSETDPGPFLRPYAMTEHQRSPGPAARPCRWPSWPPGSTCPWGHRVLVGDLAQQGMVTVHRAPSHAGGPNVALLEQVLHGLQQL